MEFEGLPDETRRWSRVIEHTPPFTCSAQRPSYNVVKSREFMSTQLLTLMSTCRRHSISFARATNAVYSKTITTTSKCSHTTTLTHQLGKLDLYPTDIDTATVGDIARFTKKNLADSHWVSSFDWNHRGRGWLMDPHCGLSPRGERSPCPTLELWNYHSSMPFLVFV